MAGWRPIFRALLYNWIFVDVVANAMLATAMGNGKELRLCSKLQNVVSKKKLIAFHTQGETQTQNYQYLNGI